MNSDQSTTTFHFFTPSATPPSYEVILNPFLVQSSVSSIASAMSDPEYDLVVVGAGTKFRLFRIRV
jgi:hypothetical protein